MAKRPPEEVWQRIREIIWHRDKRCCKRCGKSVALAVAHVDHVVPLSSPAGNNKFKNLRCLCRRCHTLREDARHRGMVAGALKKHILDENWRQQTWPEETLSGQNIR